MRLGAALPPHAASPVAAIFSPHRHTHISRRACALSAPRESRRRSAPARDRWACAPACDPSASGAWKAAAAGDGVRMEVATHP